ncbi:MAG: hypothetical protein ACOYT9_04680 [Patescibacteria group bacterium]
MSAVNAAEPGGNAQRGDFTETLSVVQKEFAKAKGNPTKQSELLRDFIANAITPGIPLEADSIRETLGFNLPRQEEIGQFKGIEFLGLGIEYATFGTDSTVFKIPIRELKLMLAGTNLRKSLRPDHYHQYIQHKVDVTRHNYNVGRQCLGSLIIDTEIREDGSLRQPHIEILPQNLLDAKDELFERERIIRSGYEGKSDIAAIKLLEGIPPAELKKAAGNLIHGLLLGYIPDIHTIPNGNDKSAFTSIWSSLAGITTENNLRSLRIYDLGYPLGNYFTASERGEIEQQIQVHGGIQNVIIIGGEGEMTFAPWYREITKNILDRRESQIENLVQYSRRLEAQNTIQGLTSHLNPEQQQRVWEKLTSQHDEHVASQPDIWLRLREQSIEIIEKWMINENLFSDSILIGTLSELLGNPRISIIAKPAEYSEIAEISPIMAITLAANRMIEAELSRLFRQQNHTITVGQVLAASPRTFQQTIEHGVNLDRIPPLSDNPFASVVKDALLLMKIAHYLEQTK